MVQHIAMKFAKTRQMKTLYFIFMTNILKKHNINFANEEMNDSTVQNPWNPIWHDNMN